MVIIVVIIMVTFTRLEVTTIVTMPQLEVTIMVMMPQLEVTIMVMIAKLDAHTSPILRPAIAEVAGATAAVILCHALKGHHRIQKCQQDRILLIQSILTQQGPDLILQGGGKEEEHLIGRADLNVSIEAKEIIFVFISLVIDYIVRFFIRTPELTYHELDIRFVCSIYS